MRFSSELKNNMAWFHDPQELAWEQEAETPPAISESDVLRRRVAEYRTLPPSHPILIAAAKLGIDITYIDETAPFGEVCGYTHAIKFDTGELVFHAIRRTRNYGRRNSAYEYTLVDDYAIYMVRWHVDRTKQGEYVNPKRGCPPLTPGSRK